MPVTRRDALRLGSGGALALVIGGGAGWLDRRDPAGSAAPTLPTASSTVPATTVPTTTAPIVIPEFATAVDPEIVQLGQRVIATTGEDDVAALLALLPDPSDDPLTDAAAVVVEEFADRRTLLVDGWVLAESEARAAAVVALLCESAAC